MPSFEYASLLRSLGLRWTHMSFKYRVLVTNIIVISLLPSSLTYKCNRELAMYVGRSDIVKVGNLPYF